VCNVKQETNVCTLCTITSSSNGCPMAKAVRHWPLKRWRPKFDTWAGHVKFGTDTVAMGQVFLQVFRCSPSVSLHQRSTIIFILTLLSSGQADLHATANLCQAPGKHWTEKCGHTVLFRHNWVRINMAQLQATEINSHTWM